MKKPNKILLPLLIASTGIALTSSITSTVAWFVYATNATVAYTGTSAHCSKLLNISVDGGTSWGTDIVSSQLPSSDPSDPHGVKFRPITTGAQLANAALPTQSYETGEFDTDGITPIMGTKTKFYASPDYRQGLYSNWLIAEDNNYLQFTILVKLTDVDENYGDVTALADNQTYLANDVYLTDLTIQNAGTNDLSDAVRVHFASTYIDSNDVVQHKYFLFSKSKEATNVGGYLDLNDNGKLDTAGYEWDDSLCLYGGADGEPNSTITKDAQGNVTSAVLNNPLKQKSYKANDTTVVATDNKGNITGGVSFGNTSPVAGQYMQITVTIWLEGWAELEKGTDDNYQDTDTSVWDSTSYASKQFNVGMTFGVQLHADNE